MALAKFLEDNLDRWHETFRESRPVIPSFQKLGDQRSREDELRDWEDRLKSAAEAVARYYNLIDDRYNDLMKILEECTDPSMNFLEENKSLKNENAGLTSKLSLLEKAEERIRKLEKENEGLRNDNKGLRKLIQTDDRAYEKMVETHMRTDGSPKFKAGKRR